VIARTPYTLDGWAGGWLSEDPIRLGLVASIPRPGGNATGINFLSGELGAKRLELLHELLPGAVRIAVLNNPSDAASAETTVREAEAGARAMGLQLLILNATAVMKFMPRSQPSRVNGPTLCFWAAIRYAPAAECNSPP
jgi:ABC-type uncharacterized transport system substrate-binding protein